MSSQLLLDPTSHTHAAAAGWSFVPPMELVAVLEWAEVWANAKRKPNSVPIRIDRPWMKQQTALEPAAPSTDDLRQRQALAERLGLA